MNHKPCQSGKFVKNYCKAVPQYEQCKACPAYKHNLLRTSVMAISSCGCRCNPQLNK